MRMVTSLFTNLSMSSLRVRSQVIRRLSRQQLLIIMMWRSRWRALAITMAVVAAPPVAGSADGQSMDRGSKVYLEVLGNGLVFSVNYEHPVWTSATVRVGAGGLWIGGVKYGLGFGMVGWELTGNRHVVHISAGAGVIHFADVFFLEGVPTTTGYGTAAIAYRYQPRPRGVFFQLSFTPTLAESTLTPWGGAAVGVAF